MIWLTVGLYDYDNEPLGSRMRNYFMRYFKKMAFKFSSGDLDLWFGA
jgi:hypothetical protein